MAAFKFNVYHYTTVPFFMRWALYISPLAWSIEQLAGSIYGDNPMLVELYGYDNSDAQTATAFCLWYFNNGSR